MRGFYIVWKGGFFYQEAMGKDEKIRRDNLTEKELCDIADILNCDYDGIFTFRDTGKQWSRDSRESLLFLYEKLNSSLDNVA